MEPQACRGGGRYFVVVTNVLSFVWEQYEFSEGVHIEAEAPRMSRVGWGSKLGRRGRTYGKT